MKVYVFPADVYGCGHYRLIWPAHALRAAGRDIHIVEPKQKDEMLQGKMRHNQMVDVIIPRDADVIVFQRITSRHMVDAIHLIRRRGVAVVIDMDDDLTCIHPAHPAFHMLHPNGPSRDHSWKNTLLACEAATLVTTSTPALLDRYARDHGRGRVLYNAVPRRMLDVPHNDSDVVGWGGSVHSHPMDLQAMGPAVAQVLQLGGKFRIVGPIAGVHAALGVPQSVEIDATGPMSLDTWPLGLSSLGIGVAPLADTKFNLAKSWLKPLEYAAVGVPCVMSPRAEYVRLHKLGVGLLAANSNEWRTKLQQLRGSANLRLEVAARGREVAKTQTIEDRAGEWWSAWSDALARQRSNPLSRVGSV